MRPILRVTPNVIELNALFIQPTRWCGLNCEGCYVKEHSEESYHTPVLEQERLFKYFYKGLNGCWANQITISIDDMPKDPDKRYQMGGLFRAIMSYIHFDSRPKDDRPEVHMTFHTHATIKQYDPSYIKLKKLDMISISEISLSQGDFYQSLRGGNALLNWNYLIPEVGPNFNWDKEIKKFEFANKYFDHIYLVIFKTPIGRYRDLLIKLGDKNRMKNDVAYIETILKKLPESIGRKISIDGCLRDTQKFIRTSFGCSSNISKFQVWPDGSVTGCPYAYDTVGKTPGRNVNDILDNIRTERGRYDFGERCHLPEVLKSI
jgi:hypothetical protein